MRLFKEHYQQVPEKIKEHLKQKGHTSVRRVTKRIEKEFTTIAGSAIDAGVDASWNTYQTLRAEAHEVINAGAQSGFFGGIRRRIGHAAAEFMVLKKTPDVIQTGIATVVTTTKKEITSRTNNVKQEILLAPIGVAVTIFDKAEQLKNRVMDRGKV